MHTLPVEFHKEKNFGVYSNCELLVEASGVGNGEGMVATYAVGNIVGADGFGGVYLFTWTVADEEFISYLTLYEIFQFLQGKPIRFIGQFTPGLTADTPEELNLFLGCMEDMDTATEMQAAGAGPRLDSDMFGFFCVESASVVFEPNYWYAVSSFGALQQTTLLNLANRSNLSGVPHKVFDGAGDGIEHEFVAEWVPTNLVPGVAGAAPTLMDAEVRFWIDGLLVAKHEMRGAFQITVAGAQEMNFGLVGSNAAASSATAALNLDFLKCEQVR